MGNFRTNGNKTCARGCGNNLPLLLGRSLPQVSVIQQCSCQVKRCPMQTQVPGTEYLWISQNVVWGWAVQLTQEQLGQLLEQLLCAEMPLWNAGLSALERVTGWGKLFTTSKIQLPHKSFWTDAKMLSRLIPWSLSVIKLCVNSCLSVIGRQLLQFWALFLRCL